MRAKDSAPEMGGARARAVPQFTRSREMPAIKLFAVPVTAGFAVSAFVRVQTQPRPSLGSSHALLLLSGP